MTWAALLLRAVLLYIFLLVLLRVSGKRTLRESGSLDLLLALVLSTVCSQFAFGRLSPVDTVAIVGVLLSMHVTAHSLARYSPPLARFLGGRPVQL